MIGFFIPLTRLSNTTKKSTDYCQQLLELCTWITQKNLFFYGSVAMVTPAVPHHPADR